MTEPLYDAERLLSALAPLGPWNVAAIPTSGGAPEGIGRFDLGPGKIDGDDGLLAWIAFKQHPSRPCNVYLNVGVGRSARAKIKKEHVIGVRALYVECDPVDANDRYDPAMRETVIPGRIAAYPRPPSIVVDSGNGFHCYWLLNEPYRVDGDPECIKEYERRTKKLCQDFETPDSCFTIDHLLALPGSMKLATQQKLDKGYPPGNRPCRIIEWHPERCYRLEDFPAVVEEDAQDNGCGRERATKTEVVLDWAAVRELAEEYKTTLPADLTPKARIILEHEGGIEDLSRTLGEAGLMTKHMKYRAWSYVTMALAATLKSGGNFSTDQMAALLCCDRPVNRNGEWKNTKDKPGNEMVRRHVRRALENSYEAKPADHSTHGKTAVSEFDHMGTARTFIERQRQHVLHYREDFLDHDGSRYAKVDDGTVKADVYNFLDGCVVWAVDKFVPFHPCTKSVGETVAALKAERHLLPSINQPCWLKGTGPDPEDLLSFENGILDLRSGELLPPNPNLFTCNAVGLNYDKGADAPTNWLMFLKQVYDDDQDQIYGLQEAYGYSMSADVSQEKAFSTVGPKRSGKDTQKNVLTALLPTGSVIGPTLDSMGTNFGMSAFLYKQLAIVGDMRLGPRCDQDLLAENVLKLTGRGVFTIDRKHKSHWTGSLPCKIWFLSNQRPRIKDVSGVLASRFINFTTRVSFYGRENRHLFRDVLRPELPGIALWALEGLRRVRERGHLYEPKSSVEECNQMARDGSPVLAFVHECLTLNPESETDKDDLHETFLDWAAANGQRSLAKNIFMGDLVAATGGKVHASRTTIDGTRVPMMKGVRISTRPAARRKPAETLATGPLGQLLSGFAKAQKETVDAAIPF